MASPARVELATLCLGGRCSIHTELRERVESQRFLRRAFALAMALPTHPEERLTLVLLVFLLSLVIFGLAMVSPFHTVSLRTAEQENGGASESRTHDLRTAGASL